MVKHVILWTLKDEYSIEEKEAIKARVREKLEGLQGKIPGLTQIKVYTSGLETSNADMFLDSTFVDEAALKTYATFPEHVDIANNYVRPFVANRSCLDYII